jgi:diacylglycerol kinase family enzyme
LDLCGLQQGRFWKYFAAIQLRLHRFLTDWSTHRVRRVRITSDAKVPYQLDGDPGGWLPLDVEVLPKRMTLIVPKEAVKSARSD